ncbi:MAG: ATP-binding cassette domain-containing protein [Anaerolineae bacterium]|jgi:ABC-2 type transport system ATP-binding protein|nr:ATP-binding cassette domain-containing protein [Anaerolineae bacterium]
MRNSSEAIIRVEHLTKTYQVRTKPENGRKIQLKRSYKKVQAVKDVTFNVQPGEILGYLGPNGAGKSTTIKMLTGLLMPTSGTIDCNGFVPWKQRTAYVKGIGAVFGQRTSLWWDLPVNDSLLMTKHLYGVSENDYKGYLDRFDQTLDLEEIRYKTARSLSLGQRMRADLCMALLHNPRLLFLDEPTIGLDVVAKERIRDFILQVNAEMGTTVILTTHDISDVEKLCPRVIIIDEGQKLYDGGLAELKTRFGGHHRIEVQFAEAVENLSVPLAETVNQDEYKAVITFDPNKVTSGELIKELVTTHPVREIDVRPPEVETTIRKIYEEKLLRK